MTSATLISKATIRSGIRIPSAGGGLLGQFHHPCLGMARAGPSRSIGPLPGGNKFFKVITGFKFLAPCIGKRASKSVTDGITRYRCHR